MYDLPHHKAHDDADIRALIDQYPFAFLTGCDADGKPVATQLPLFIEEDGDRRILRGHIMKRTDHHEAFLHNPNVLAVFNGRHTYVSGTWYSDPYIASTWNYMSVHVQGKIRFLDTAALEDALRKITLHFEDNNTASTTIYDNLPEDFKKRVMHMIVAFEVEITSIDSVFKLSQDRDAESYLNIIAKLKDQDEDGRVIAAEMEKRMNRVFG
jgi:transcriptional regulator